MSYSKQFIVSAMIAGALSSSPVLFAQEMSETALNVEIEGVMTDYYGMATPLDETDYTLPLDFIIRVRQEIDEYTLLGSSGPTTSFGDVDLTLEIELLDANGEVFYSDSQTTVYPQSNECIWGAPITTVEDVPIWVDAQNSAYNDALRLCVQTKDFSSIYKLFELYVGVFEPWSYGPTSDVEENLVANGPERSVYQLNAEGYPEFVLGENVQVVEFINAQHDLTDIGDPYAEPDESLYVDFIFTGYTTRIQALINDADDDGIADEVDQCDASLLDETVSFDGVDSGVTNVVDANGCSVMDHYAACEAEQQGSGFLGYSGASYCEQQVAYQLYRDGLIDYADVRALRNALN
ncbi:hypothetical protein CWI80_04545 [Pseudidiomarina sediminum]|uniref:Uncharacterized protein n=1 Tax=Pseudidiomarina sediminum TaxID=431675 RepID=A0A432Z9J4_9GAMM|nr:hypothetical protein [Pseudidiomarina sediminum]RUO74615.1 hypothetical protein CWI80_04545 [Pseudidiomarina sediminum]